MIGIMIVLVFLSLSVPAAGSTIIRGGTYLCINMNNQTTHSVLTFLRLNTTMTDFAYYSISAAMTDQYFIDSGCTRTI
eukprot:2953465-Rhodomonas_salina.1